jgi:hypothetical protein
MEHYLTSWQTGSRDKKEEARIRYSSKNIPPVIYFLQLGPPPKVSRASQNITTT